MDNNWWPHTESKTGSKTSIEWHLSVCIYFKYGFCSVCVTWIRNYWFIYWYRPWLGYLIIAYYHCIDIYHSLFYCSLEVLNWLPFFSISVLFCSNYYRGQSHLSQLVTVFKLKIDALFNIPNDWTNFLQWEMTDLKRMMKDDR